MTTKRMTLALVLAWTACDSAPSIERPAGSPINVLPASAETAQRTSVAEWQLFQVGAAAGQMPRFIAYGVDGTNRGVAAMQLAFDGDRTIESTVMKNGAWDERFVLEVATGDVTIYTQDFSRSQLLWARLAADIDAYQARGPLGTQSAGVPYSVCDGCTSENLVAGGTCAASVLGIVGGVAGFLIGGVSCVPTVGAGCVVAAAAVGVGVAAGVACVGTVQQASQCWDDQDGPTCDPNANLEVDLQNGLKSCGDHAIPTQCKCVAGTKLDGSGACVQICPACYCNIVLNGSVLTCGIDYGPAVPLNDGSNGVTCPNGGDRLGPAPYYYCCPAYTPPPIPCVY